MIMASASAGRVARHSIVLHPRSKPGGEQKHRDDAKENSRIAGPLEAVHLFFASSPIIDQGVSRPSLNHEPRTDEDSPRRTLPTTAPSSFSPHAGDSGCHYRGGALSSLNDRRKM